MSKEYKVIEANNAADLSDQVDAMLEEGWTIHGNISVQGIGGVPLYTQVVVRDKDNLQEGKQLLHG